MTARVDRDQNGKAVDHVVVVRFSPFRLRACAPALLLSTRRVQLLQPALIR